MAKIEDLIKNIPDPQLRDELAREVAKLKAGKKFGLVFEEHIPEQVQIPGLPVKPGLRVVKRGGKNNEVFKVLSFTDDSKAILTREPDGAQEIFPAQELVVIKKFGEPIYPTLTPIDRVIRAHGKPFHTLINADNFHALQLLEYCYAGQVDVIYIDPPYNTGARDWKYNNDYVDNSDEWKHSKWLSFMQKRLLLARKLLSHSGVLVVTIDEHEVHHLGMLLENIFPDAYRQMVSIVVNPKGVTQGRFSRVEEHALFCFLGNSTAIGRGDDLLTAESEEESDNNSPRWKGLLRSGTNAQRIDRKNLFYPVLIDPDKEAVVGTGEPLPFDQEPDIDARINGYVAAWPIRTDGSLGNWGVGHISLRELIKKGYVSLGSYDSKRHTYGISYLSKKIQNQITAGLIEIVEFDEQKKVVDVRYKDIRDRQIKTIWHRTSHDAGAYGSDMLKNILGGARAFSFPKSLYAVKDTIGAITRDHPDALILDFFAGSGTTLHATLLQNVEDNGNRRCILVTNNEVNDRQTKELSDKGLWPGEPDFEKYGIADAVTFPRCKFAINGKRDDGTELSGTYLSGREWSEGFSENLEYFRLDFLDHDEIAYGNKFEAILPILWLMAGAQGNREPSVDTTRWFIPTASPFAVLLDETAFAEFKREIKNRTDITFVFLVTDSERAYREMIADLPQIPHTRMLYKNYLDNFRINTENNL